MIRKLAVILFLTMFSAGVLPLTAHSQQQSLQDMIVNGGFEGGFQEEFGVGYGWGGFSNGNAVVGWGYDDWGPVVSDGDYAQRLEISEVLDQDRIIGIYQTVSVVPGEQYKLSLTGLVRSGEGSVDVSDYGYRIQYAIDYDGQTAWELLEGDAWQELPWDEQPLATEGQAAYQMDTYNTTVTAQSERMTLFVRGWKKWLDNGTGVFNLDEISLIGPAPQGFQAPVSQQPQPAAESNEAVAEVAGVATEPESAPAAETAPVADAPAAVVAESDIETTSPAESVESSDSTVAETEALASSTEETEVVSEQVLARSGEDTTSLAQVAPLPATGQGGENSLIYIVVVGSVVLLALFASAIMATTRRHSPVDR
jgi:hypothetical protein